MSYAIQIAQALTAIKSINKGPAEIIS